ncbi:MAG: hypothetical protein BA867_14680 [Desulfobacterales bacterium S5133MH16]|nr:MAG: hypothetical protein BA867_14680 [Desulfobacterales bacterium S5133MH16]
MNETFELIALIGTPFSDKRCRSTDRRLESIYKKAFADRVALLYLTIHRYPGWSSALENMFLNLNERRDKTLEVVANLADLLNSFCPNEYAIFKSLKPYPATPNDTDVIIFGDKKRFKGVIKHLYSKSYIFHEWAPMQTTLIDPMGKGKTGKGKKGGIYYIDMYSDISTDYFLYINKRSLNPYVQNIELNGVQIKNVRKEVELAIILFHNVFPERTFQLEHFYMPLYHLKEDNFDLDVMIEFAENQKLTRAVAANLTFVEYIHRKLFGFVPERIVFLLDRWGRNSQELEKFKARGETTPYMISPKTFWLTFYDKIHDKAAFRSLIVQGVHMLNPVFFFDVMRSLKNRFSERGTYHLE